MFDFDRLRRSAAAAVAAIFFTATTVGAAVGPGFAPVDAPAVYAQVSFADAANG